MRAEIVDLATSVAQSHELDPALLATILAVESGGVPCYADGAPTMLVEKHAAYERSALRSEALQASFLKAGLATRKWTGDYSDQKGEAARMALFACMRELDADVAYESCSFGLGQVMGWHAVNRPSNLAGRNTIRRRDGSLGWMPNMLSVATEYGQVGANVGPKTLFWGAAASLLQAQAREALGGVHGGSRRLPRRGHRARD